MLFKQKECPGADLFPIVEVSNEQDLLKKKDKKLINLSAKLIYSKKKMLDLKKLIQILQMGFKNC
jgi:hypothetical protein